MSESKRPKLVNLSDRRPQDNELQIETVAMLEQLLKAARAGHFDQMVVITRGPEVYGFNSTFAELADATLARDHLSDYLQDWRTEG